MRPLDSVTRRADSASNRTRRLLWSPDANPRLQEARLGGGENGWRARRGRGLCQ